MDNDKVSFNWNDDVLTIKVNDFLLLEDINAALEEYLEIVNNPPRKKFAVIYLLNELSLTTPSGFETMANIWQEGTDLGCRARAFVVPNAFQEKVLIQHLPEKGKTFQEFHDAQEWVDSQMQE